MSSSSERPNYRPDVDGLRAIAVLSVIAFHAWPDVWSGGYLGVDIFFVISGYLIMGIAVTERASGTFRIADFYLRRARRLLPALLVVLGLTLAASLVLLQAQEIVLLARSTMASIAWVSNIYFWRNTGYFEDSATAQVLLHTWSLAVEEQFYLLFPLLLHYIVPTRDRSRQGILLCLMLGSAALSGWASLSHPNANFFLLPFRAWELLVGASLALRHAGRKQQDRGASRGRHLLGLLGLVCISISLAFADSFRGYTFGFALATVLGTAALLHSGRETGAVTTWLLSRRTPVFLGLISYSLYLWHQPVLTLARLSLGETLAQKLLPLQLAFIVLISWLSWRWIEQRWRHRRAVNGQFVGWMFAAALTVFSLAALLQLNHGSLISPTPAKRALLSERYEYSDAFRLRTCFLASDQLPEAFEDCSVRGLLPEGRDTLLWGDSYAAHFWSAMEIESSWYSRLRQRTVSGCAPLIDDERATRYCRQARNYVMREVRRVRPDHVVLSARWTASQLASLARTIQSLHDAGVVTITVLGPTPRWRGGLPGWLALTAATDGTLSSELKPIHETEQMDLNRAVKATAEASGARFVDLLVPACPNWPLCRTLGPAPAQSIFYFDDGHLTRAGAFWLVPRIVSELRS